jgi:threonylcarbamoyladenosine tRNA methylthiotransferase MtaB
MNVQLKTLGCRLNEAELETWGQAFQKAGHRITRHAESAQLIIINTCAVTHDAARKSRNLIRRIHRDNPAAKLIVSGCYATLHQEETAALMGVDLVIGNRDKDRLVDTTLAHLDLASMPTLAEEPGAVSLFSRGRQRAFVKVQDGCRYRCTYCIVTLARGEEISRDPKSIIDEINALASQQIHEIVLTGVHLGGYGSDNQFDLADLLQLILKETDVPRIRLGSLEPWELSDEFFGLFANSRLMPHLHLPLQSGSDAVLRRMARRCKTSEFAAIVNTLKCQNSNFNITSDIIVGFPGETEQEWQESLAFIKDMAFGDLHIFTYSPREGTKAASLPGQINSDIKKHRSRTLHELAREMKRNFYKSQLGATVPVLWEGHTEPVPDAAAQWAFGYSPNYLRVGALIANTKSLENRILNASLLDSNERYAVAALHD